MRVVLALALMFSALASMPASAGPCEHSYDKDSAGNNCGRRAADQRKGGG